MAEVLVLYAFALSMHGLNISVLQLIACPFIVCLPLKVMVVDNVIDGKLASSTIHFSENRLIAVYCGKCVGELRTQNIAAYGFLNLDIYDICNFYYFLSWYDYYGALCSS